MLAWSVGALLVAGSVLAQQAGAGFNPRDLKAMPDPTQIPAPSMSEEQVRSECRRLFDGRSYTGVLAVERTPGRPLSSGPFFADFKIIRPVFFSERMRRPLCEVEYVWKTGDYTSFKTPSSFGGRFLIGKDFIIEAKGLQLLLTVFHKDGVGRSWSTLQ
jgi:hypothetical protein